MYETKISNKDISITVCNKAFDNISKCKYLGTTLANRNNIHDEIRKTINSGNACYYSVTKTMPYTFQNIEDQDMQNNNCTGCFILK
jgi:hypothetical protein